MGMLVGKLQKILHCSVLFGLLCGGLVSPVFADGLITIEPATAAPDENGVVRFSVVVAGVPVPGFRSYALSVRFEGAAINLVDNINSITQPPPADTVSCAAKLRLDAVRDTVLPGTGVILESGQGAFVLDSVGSGTLLAIDNRIIGTRTAQYNLGVAGETGMITPGINDGSLIDFLCLVGSAVPAGTHITVTPGLYPGIHGVIFLDQPGSSPLINTFNSGYIELAGANTPPVLDPVGDQIVTAGERLSFLVTASDPDWDSLTYTVHDLPPGASFTDHGDGTGAFDWIPELDKAGDYQITFTVSDEGIPPLSTSENITITVEPGVDAVPGAPKNLRVRLKGPHVVLKWRDSEVASTFFIYRRLITENNFHKIDETTSRAYKDRLEWCTESADYYVVAGNEYGQSEASRIVTTSIKNLPRNCNK